MNNLEIIDEVIKMFINDNELVCAYLDKTVTSKEANYSNHLFLIFKDNINSNVLTKICKKVESLTYIVFYEQNDSSLQIVTDNNVNIFFYKVKEVYNFKDLKILYNPFNYNPLCCSEDEPFELLDEVSENIVLIINKYMQELYNVYTFIQNNNGLLAFNSLNDVNEQVLIFLANKYLNIPYKKNFFFANMEEVLSKMEKDNLHKYLKISSMLKIDSIKECSKLLIWFMDDYIANLPISVAQNIDIDFYLHIKNLFLKI